MGLPEHTFERAALNWNEASSRLSPTPGTFAREHLVYVQEAGYFETESGYFTERRDLDSLLMILTVSGQGRIQYRGQSWTMDTSSLLWIDCREHHYYESSPEAAWKFFWVHFTGANSQAYYQQFNEQANGQPVIPLHTTADKDLAEQFGKLIRQQSNHGLSAEMLSAQILVELMTWAVLQDKGHLNPQEDYHPAVSSAIHIMENTLSGGIGLKDLAARVQVSPYYLIKLFVRQIGLTPMSYWQQLRLSEAKRLLHQTNWTVERISDAVGLVPSSHFISIFKKIESMTPRQYRKRWQGEIKPAPGTAVTRGWQKDL